MKESKDGKNNVLTLMVGTSLAQALPIAAAPILTRLYTPDDFGALTLFASIVIVLGSITTGKYELATLLPDNDKDAAAISALAICINLFFCSTLFLAVFLFGGQIEALLEKGSLPFSLYLIPASVFLLGLINVFTYFNIRHNEYRSIRNSEVIKSSAAVTAQVSGGLLKSGVAGLLGGQLLSQLLAAYALHKKSRQNGLSFSGARRKRINEVRKAYIDFPKYSVAAGLSNTSAQHLTSALIPIFFTAGTLGLYGLVQRVLGAPTKLIGESFGKVFFSQAAIEKRATGSARKVFLSTLKKLIVIGLPIYTGLYFCVEDLFSFVFGPEWVESGAFARALVPLFFVRFVISPLTRINQVYMKNKNVMVWQIGLVIITFSVLYFAGTSCFSFLETLHLLVPVLSIYYIIHLVLLFSYTAHD